MMKLACGSFSMAQSDSMAHSERLDSFAEETERRANLEHRLCLSEERLRDFAETAACWCWESDNRHRFTEFFGSIELLGLNCQRLIGLTRWELPGVDPNDPVWKGHQADLKTHRPFSGLEYSYVDEHRRSRIAHVSGKPLFDVNETFLGYRGTAQDITQSKASETARLASEERYRKAARLANLGHWTWDELEKKCEYCSEEVAEIHGVSVEEFLERSSSVESDRQWYHPDDRDHYQFVTSQAARNKTGYDTIVRIVRDDGTVRYLHESTEGVTDQNGVLTKTVGVLQDVTDKMRAEKAMRESERRLKTFFDNLPGGAYRVCNDDNWTAGFRSAGYLDIVAAQRPEVSNLDDAGCYPALDVHQADVARIREKIAAAIRQNSIYDFEYRITTQTGEERWMWERGRCVSEPGEKPEILEGMILDVTQDRKTEQALLQSQKMEIVGQMAGGIAHDFNNLLGVIQGNAELLALKELKDNIKLQAILRATARGAALTDRLLAYSRQQVLDPKAVDLNTVVDVVIELAGRLLSSEITIELAKATGVWTCWIDPGQLENALLNLVINSRDAMPEGGTLTIATANFTRKSIELGALTEMEAGDYVKLDITDTGHGISAEDLSSVFEPFFTTKEVGKGTGLGLSMVHGFAKQSGGHATIHSVAGQGTTVTLYLPRNLQSLPLPPENPANVLGERHAGGLVLLVEDEPDLRALIFKQLQGLGYEVLQASNGRQAEHFLSTHPNIDLLLTDIVLPGGLSGLDISRNAISCRPELPVILMSGYPEHVSLNDNELLRAVQFIQKPFLGADLAAKVGSTLIESRKSHVSQ